MILEQASDHPVYQLDLWMVGEQHCRQLLSTAASQADIILIEGVMGLFDGTPSTADLAATLDIPVIAVIDGSAMAQTFGALAYGLKHFRNDITVASVIANRVGSERHTQMLIESLPNDLPCYAVLPRQQDNLPSRHLGLVQANEIDDLQDKLTNLAEQLIIQNNDGLPIVEFSSKQIPPVLPLLKGVRIAIAKDAAFSFVYQANLDLLQQMGAELLWFSPLSDTSLPATECLYLPGGYPELYLQTLANNTAMQTAIKAHYDANKPIVSECGGMLYLTESLTDKQGNHASMTGILSGHAVMQSRFSALALQQITLNDETLRGHTYHHSLFESSAVPITHAVCPTGGKIAEAIYQQKRLTASLNLFC